MTDSPDPPVLAIDGGGTRCRIALKQGGAVTVVETGPANVSTDFDGALAEIETGLTQLCARTGQSRDRLAALPAFVGLAGVTGPEIAARLRAALPFARVRIEDDRPAALAGALGERHGVIAHCGTGSFLAARIGGQMRFAGGWGSVLGDEASAQWAGRRALTLTLDRVDDRLAPSPLSETLLARFGGAPGIVRFAATARPETLGALAPEVTAAAAAGDAIACRVMREGAAYIARGLSDLGWRPGLTLCLTGGIGPHYAGWLPGDMRPYIAPAEAEPLCGALALARAEAAETNHDRG